MGSLAAQLSTPVPVQDTPPNPWMDTEIRGFKLSRRGAFSCCCYFCDPHVAVTVCNTLCSAAFLHWIYECIIEP